MNTPTLGALPIDLPRLLETRALIVANSGAGKSWGLRRVLEQTAGQVQQIVIDPEGEFSTLRERFDYIVCAPRGAAAHAPDAPASLADVHAGFLAMVTRPQAALLQVLIDTYPAPMHKSELASKAGVSAASSGFANNLGSLRSLGVLDYPMPGYVAATSLLFPKGTK